MKRDGFVGNPTPGRIRPSLSLEHGVTVVRAVMRSATEIRAGDLFVTSRTPIRCLCAALWARGDLGPEVGLLVTWADGTPALFVLSIGALIG